MKGIVLAGGAGTRLYPLTKSVSKQLLPLYDKPTIYYPISVLMLSGIREILIISTPRDIKLIEDLLGDGSQFGVKFTYKEQGKPNGIAEAFLIGEEFIDNDPVCLILGDNFFYGHDFQGHIKNSAKLNSGAEVYAYHVQNPESYGVVNFSDDGNPSEIEEKPKNPKSNWAVSGLYFYDSNVVQYAKELEPSARGELEITDINRRYLKEGTLRAKKIGRGVAWLDTGSYDTLLQASEFVQTIQKRQGLMVGCLEEIALEAGFIDLAHVRKISEQYPNSEYGIYLKQLGK